MQNDLNKHLRNALNHLYDLDYLRQSPLVSVFGLANRFDAASALQRLLLDSIESLRPTPASPLSGDRKKTYDILNFRYIQQFNQNEVAHHLGVSERQFRREQVQALDVLANHLGKKIRTLLPGDPLEPAPPPAAAVQGDWSWLKESHEERVTNLPGFLQTILDLMQPVAGQHQVRLVLRCAGNFPDLSVHPVALRQMLLNLLQVAILRAEGGQVELEAVQLPSFIELRTLIPFPEETGRGQPGRTEQEENLLLITTHLAQLSAGRLVDQRSETSCAFTLSLPLVDSISVLAVDDNPDILDLLTRYCIGTRYRLTATSQPDTVTGLAESINARIIVLDVMMPRVDGWEMLDACRHPHTAHIPVIVLTILAQEELALTLGAKALVLKPVTQERFLAALDEVYEKLNSNFR